MHRGTDDHLVSLWHPEAGDNQSLDTIRDGLAAGVASTRNWVRAAQWLVAFEAQAAHSGVLRVYSSEDLSLVETRPLPRLADVTPSGQRVMAVAISPDFTPAGP